MDANRFKHSKAVVSNRKSFELHRNAEDKRSIIFSLSFKDDFIRGDKKKSANQISTQFRGERLSEDKAWQPTRDEIPNRLLSMGLF